MTWRRIGRRQLLGGAAIAAGGLAVPGAAEASARRPRVGSPAPLPGPDPGALLFRLLPAPVRAYDSRPGLGGMPNGTDPLTGATDVKWVHNTIRQIDVELVLGQAALGETGVPNLAAGVLMNVTVIGITAAGRLQAWSPDAPRPQASSMNWAATTGILNTPVTTRCADGYVSIGVFGAPGLAVDVVIDLVGWFEPAA